MSRKHDRQMEITTERDGLNDVQRLMLHHFFEHDGAIDFGRCTEADRPTKLSDALIAGITRPRGLDRRFWKKSVEEHTQAFIDNGVFQIRRCGKARISQVRLDAVINEVGRREVLTRLSGGYVNRARSYRRVPIAA